MARQSWSRGGTLSANADSARPRGCKRDDSFLSEMGNRRSIGEVTAPEEEEAAAIAEAVSAGDPGGCPMRCHRSAWDRADARSAREGRRGGRRRAIRPRGGAQADAFSFATQVELATANDLLG